MDKQLPAMPFLRAVLGVALSLVVNATSTASALDYTFTDNMIYWAPLNTAERVDVKGADNTIPPYCQINMDPMVNYMESFCYFSDYEPKVWREHSEDKFFYLKSGAGEVEMCNFRFYRGREIMLVTGCKLGGTWSRDKFWMPE